MTPAASFRKPGSQARYGLDVICRSSSSTRPNHIDQTGGNLYTLNLPNQLGLDEQKEMIEVTVHLTEASAPANIGRQNTELSARL